MSTKLSGELGWWEVSNCSDLWSPSSWNQTIQSRYLGVEPERPNIKMGGLKRKSNSKDIPSKENEPQAGSMWLVYVSITTVIILIGMLIGVIIIARKNAKLLSDEEVKEFIQGKLESPEDNTDESIKHIRDKFKPEFEMKQTDISLDTKNVLGVGNFRVVYRALLSDGTHRQGSEVAVKMPQVGCGKESFMGMLHEVKLMGYLGAHVNIVRFIGAYTKEIPRGVLYVVMEFCTGGSLLEHLKTLRNIGKADGRPTVKTRNLIRFCKEIARGMEYICSKGVVHGDLAARNVLLGEHGICKICDFGLSRKLYDYQIYSKKGREEELPWRWMSIESLKNLKFSTMSDVWSFGVTVWEIFSFGDVPYGGMSWTPELVNELEQGVRLLRPHYATAEIFESITSCWNIEPDQRPTFSELAGAFSELTQYTVFM